MLIVNVEGDSETVARHVKDISTIAGENKTSNIVTIEGEKLTIAWNAYRGIHQSILSAKPSTVQGKASVPINKLGDMFTVVKEVGDKHGVEIGVLTRCGNGIIYPYFTAGNADVARITDDLRKTAEGLGGYFIVEVAPLQVRKSMDGLPQRNDYPLMKRLKAEFDPNNILNLGRVMGGV